MSSFISGVNLTAESSQCQIDAYIKSAEWDLEDFSAVNNGAKYDCCQIVYPYVLYTIRIRRRSLYYLTNIVVPCFVVSCMAILGFLLAADSGEKDNHSIKYCYVQSSYVRNYAIELYCYTYHHHIFHARYDHAWFLCMKRPNYDLTWRGIRSQWARHTEKPNNTNGSIGSHHARIPSESLLSNRFELLPNNTINENRQPLPILE
ncbi:unnamed protein product [Rotaria magnacalcarata]|uniref:Uncharacterized protein n=1 Tax=Rotaria magnacalcarata TaxID=392030 RepID=A0A815PYR0_9BILA|nr:unnamed protein product [Rotaria magnacalcarata]